MVKAGCFGSCGGRSEEDEGVVTLLLGNGKALEYPARTKCSELLASHPKHRVCLAKDLLQQPAGWKMMPKEAVLAGGQIYALVPKPVPGRPLMQFVIAKEYLATLRGEEAVVTETRFEEQGFADRSKNSNGARRRGARVHAQGLGALDSISESED